MIRLLLYLMICLLTLNIAGCSNIISDDGLKTQEESINQGNNTDYKRIQVELAQPNDGDTIAVVYKGKRESVRFFTGG